MKFDARALPLLSLISLSLSPAEAQGALRGLQRKGIREGGNKEPGKGPGKGGLNASGRTTMIVAFKDDDNDVRGAGSKCEALARAAGGTVGKVFRRAMNGCTIELSNAAVGSMGENSMVKYMEADQEVRASATIQNPIWGLDRTDQCGPLPGPDQQPYTQMDATGVRVYILDTGVQGSHPALTNHMMPSGSNCHIDLVNEGNALDDGHGHGTHVAGTACGDTYGVATKCDICAVKVLSASGSGSNAGVIDGIEHVMENCAADGATCVANMSLGGGFSQLTNTAVNNAVAAGVVFVVAAGNDNQNACNYSPASAEDAITVGSVTQSNDQRSSFSNWGTCTDVYAPGSGITSSIPPSGTTTWSGTSMASPHVAGIAAGIRAADPGLTATQVNSKIFGDAKLTDVIDPGSNPMRVANNVGGCNPPTPPPTPAPTFPPCSPDEFKVTVDLKTDNYPSETEWTLRNTCTDTELLRGNSYSAPGHLHSKTTPGCFAGGQFEFAITDSYGDGICCAYGSGWYEVKNDKTGEVMMSGGEFGQSETTTFGSCGETPPTPSPVTPAPTSPPTPNPTNPPTLNPSSAPTTEAPTFFTCSQYDEADCIPENECQWIGNCHNCGCVPLPR